MKEDYLEEIKKEITYIKPHEEDDLEWYNEGMEFLENKEYEKAEKKFKELIISQPEHFDGYEGLATVYKELGKKDEALFFMKEVMKIAEKFVKDGSMDKEALDYLKEQYKEIENL